MKRFAVDIGGTFTDLVAFDEETGKISIMKLPTTPQDPNEGLLDCIKEAALLLSDYSLFVHGTTIGLNTYLQKKGAEVALITTKGFRDVYEIGRTNRVDAYNLKYKKPKRLVPRRHIFTVSERMNFKGDIIENLDEKEVREAIEKIVKENIKSIAVCFLHSYANPSHEEMVSKLIKGMQSDIYISVSNRIIREYREYERTSVAVLDAYIKPLITKYLTYLEKLLQQEGFKGDFMIQRSGGGVIPSAIARERPVETLFSGPAGGVMGGLYIAKNTPYKNLILGDVGGTSFDVSLINNGQAEITTEMKIEDTAIMIPTLDIRSVGAGGGSIAWLDMVKSIHVGPQSAGADPGPVCYKKGGIEPTVTDAAVVNKYINPNNFIGGKMSLDVNRAEEFICKKLADPLGLSVVKTANGIIEIMINRMVGLIREIMIEKGKDLREYNLLMFGGAGPLFASFILERLDISKVIIPNDPANFSAYGMMMTDVVHDYHQTFVRLMMDTDLGVIKNLFEEIEKEGSESLIREGIPESKRRIFKSVDVRYLGQTHTFNIPIEHFSESIKLEIADNFSKLYEIIYGYRLDNPIQIVRLSVRVTGVLQKPELIKLKERGTDVEMAIKETREIFLPQGLTKCLVYDRAKLGKGNRIQGPAIVEEASSVTFVGDNQNLMVDEWGNLIIERRRK